jgi:hypothetical protein
VRSLIKNDGIITDKKNHTMNAVIFMHPVPSVGGQEA